MKISSISTVRSQLILLAFLLASTLQSAAQWPVETGDKYDLVTFGVGASTHGLPVFVCVEQSYDDSKSYGALLSYRHYNTDWQVGSYSNSYVGLAARGDQHFNLDVQGLDLFAGLNVGWYLHWWKQTGGTTTGASEYANNGGLGFGGQVGARYAWDDLSFFLQLGGGSIFSGALIGLSYSL